MGSTKVHWTLTDEAIALINASTTPGKRGELVSDIILSYSRIMSEVPTTPADCGIQERIEDRLQLIEQRLAALLMLVREGQLPTMVTREEGATA